MTGPGLAKHGAARPYAVLGIDQGRRSGWAYLTRHSTCLGVATTLAQRVSAVRNALSLAHADGLTLIACLEDHAASGRGRGKARAERGTWATAPTLLGMGEARGRWAELLELSGVGWTRVSPETWRPRVLGIKGTTRTDAAKSAAVRWAEGYTDAPGNGDPDSAEALAIAHWALRSPEVAPLARAAARRRRAPIVAWPLGRRE